MKIAIVGAGSAVSRDVADGELRMVRAEQLVKPGWADTWLDPAFADWDMRDEIPKWRHPVLFIQGRQDPYGSEGQAAAADRARDAQIAWIDDCGHSPHLDQQARTLALIKAFVSARLRGIGDGG